MHHLEDDNLTFVYRVLEYIHRNLSDDLSLEKLSGIASYSPFHFQRIFTKAVGESPKQYIIRLRLEKAAHVIRIFPEMKLTEISGNSGFSSLSTFSRAFKNYFGVSPDEYKNNPSINIDRICKTDSKKCKTASGFSDDLWRVKFMQKNMEGFGNEIEIVVKRMPGKQLYYTQTCLETADSITLSYRKLCKWAGSRALITPDSLFIGTLLDIPFITPIDKCRYQTCISSSVQVKESNGISKGSLEQGLYASYSIKGDFFTIINSLAWVNHKWMPDSGYKLADIFGYEIFQENPSLKPLDQIRREILLPVKPA